MTVPLDRFFAPCPRGLEAPLAAELEALGAQFVAAAEGGVSFSGRANSRCTRTSSRGSRAASCGRSRTAATAARTTSTALVKDVDWPAHFRVDRTLRVDLAATRSPLQSLEFATLKVKDAVCDRFRDAGGTRPSVDKERPDVRVHAYLTDREATLYLDTSGEPLFKRGYRRDADVAPLRENLAAGLLALAGWTPGTPLLDPMCGSGTIADRGGAASPPTARPASAAPSASRSSPGSTGRRGSGSGSARATASAPRPRRPDRFASDVDAAARSTHAAANAAAAGVAEWIASRGRRRARRAARRRRPASSSPIRPTACGSTARRRWPRSTRGWATR